VSLQIIMMIIIIYCSVRIILTEQVMAAFL